MLCRPYSRLDLHVIVSPIACLLLVNRRPQNLKDKKAEEKAKLFPPGRSSLPQGKKRAKIVIPPRNSFWQILSPQQKRGEDTMISSRKVSGTLKGFCWHVFPDLPPKRIFGMKVYHGFLESFFTWKLVLHFINPLEVFLVIFLISSELKVPFINQVIILL